MVCVCVCMCVCVCVCVCVCMAVKYSCTPACTDNVGACDKELALFITAQSTHAVITYPSWMAVVAPVAPQSSRRQIVVACPPTKHTTAS